MRFLRIVIVFIALLFFGGFFYFSTEVDIQQFLIDSLQDASSHYFSIIIIIFGITLLSTLTGLPVLYLSVALGFFLPFLPALGLAWIINFVAIMATYYMVKKVYSTYFKEKYGKKKVIQKINKRIKKYGFWTIALSRSVYIIPTNIINLSFPLSKISAKQYAIGTMLGLIPECIINIITGSLLKRGVLLLDSTEQHLWETVITAISLITIIVGFLLFRQKRKRSKADKINDIVPLLGDK